MFCAYCGAKDVTHGCMTCRKQFCEQDAPQHAKLVAVPEADVHDVARGVYDPEYMTHCVERLEPAS